MILIGKNLTNKPNFQPNSVKNIKQFLGWIHESEIPSKKSAYSEYAKLNKFL